MASINLSSFAGAGAQFFDSNGTPLVGGLLYVYTAGTTTPVVTWTSPSGTVANTNPIVLDAGGRTPNEIWVTGGVLYKFVLKTSTGITIGSYDSIPAIDDPTSFNNLITVTGTNTLIGTSTPSNTAYATGMTLSFVVVNTNTGAVTIDVDGLGAKEITFSGSTPLIAGQMTAGALVTIEYDGTRFQLMNSSGALAITASSINGGQIAGFRNIIINGDMRVAQRGTSFANPSASYTLDQWSYFRYGNGVTTVSQSSDVPTNQGLTNSLQVAVTTVETSTLVGTFVRQSIEGYNSAQLIGRTFTVSFWVKSGKVGSYSLTFATGSPNVSYVATYDIFAANTWEYKTISVNGGLRASDSPNTTNGKGLECYFMLNADASVRTSTLNSWLTSPALAATSQVNVLDTVGNIFAITGVQLEIGSTATPFEQRLYGTELALCQRYLPVFGLNDSAMGQATISVLANVSISFNVPTRVAPTGISAQNLTSFVLTSAGGGALPVTSLSFGTTGTNSSVVVVGVSGGGLTTGNATTFTSTSGTPRLIFTGCEL